MFHEGNQRGRRDDEDGGKIKFREDEFWRAKAEVGSGEYGEIYLAEDGSNDVSYADAEDDGHELEKALAEDGNDDHRGHNGDGDDPAHPQYIRYGGGGGENVVKSGRRQGKADDNDHGTRYNRREKAGDAFYAKAFNQQRQHQIQSARDDDAARDIRQSRLIGSKRGVVFRAGRNVAIHLGGNLNDADESKTGTDKHGHLSFGAKMEYKRAKAGCKQRNVGIQACENRHQNRCAKHGEQMLNAQ